MRWLAVIFSPASLLADGPSYNFEVRPILANKCFRCHGPDEKARKKKLRLDDRAAALAAGAIVPGNPDESESIKRIFSTDPDEVMPPPDSHLELSEPEKEILRKWVEAGAVYEPHWAYTPVKKPPLPNETAVHSMRDAVDAFVVAEAKKQGLEPSPPAEKRTWLRRVTFALTGLPPTVAELDAFEKDDSPEAWEKQVDRLLASPHYGERLALDWLDAARYADTYGRHEDADSYVWPYRDWVIKAFNENLPYNDFLTYQTAGDLLPNATRDMKVATAFNRLVIQSNEAGSNEEEFRQEHVADRLRTNGMAILGISLECVRCHDHKYDPFTMKDYYSMAAFFNKVDECGVYADRTAAIPAPTLELTTPAVEEKRDSILAEIAATEKALKEAKDPFLFAGYLAQHQRPPAATPVAHFNLERYSRKEKLVENVIPNDKPMQGTRITAERVAGKVGYGLKFLEDNPLNMKDYGEFSRSDPFSFAFWIFPTEHQHKAMLAHRSRGFTDAGSRGYEIFLNQMRPEFALNHFAPYNSIRIRAKHPVPVNAWTHLAATYDGSSRAAGLKLYVNGDLAEVEVLADQLTKDITYRKEWGDYDPNKVADNIRDVYLQFAWRYNDVGAKHMVFDEIYIYDKVIAPVEVRALALRQDTPSTDDLLPIWLRDIYEPSKKLLAKLRELRRKLDEDVVHHIPEIMVMNDHNAARETFILTRGQFDQKGEKVEAMTPASLNPFPADAPRNRLGLAKWYTSPENPLVSRVAVNRLWQIFFGRGLVATTEDFGIQGELPSHPALLDWLAADFMEHGWDVKRFCKEIALSKTFRQSSLSQDKTNYEKDPANKYLSRGPRLRLPAEFIRDQALAVSGLLVPKLGGPSVKPYQPEGLWEESGTQHSYYMDRGESLWRRSMYTFWRRTLPPPSMSVFDAPTREFCLVRRERTQTPLQALVLMNDVQFVEACRVRAEQAIKDFPGKEKLDDRLSDSFRRFTGRTPTAAELGVLRRLFDDRFAHFSAAPKEAEKLLVCGEAPHDSSLAPAEIAAQTLVERLLLSLEETIVIR